MKMNQQQEMSDYQQQKRIYKIKFTKMHGCGNDFVLFKREDIRIININDNNQTNPVQYSPTLKELSYISKSISNRKLGIGCDQVIIVSDSPSSKSDYEMLIYNNDGSTASMCGNGVRCFSKYISDNRIASIFNEDGSLNVDRIYRERQYQRVHTLAGTIITYPLRNNSNGEDNDKGNIISSAVHGNGVDADQIHLDLEGGGVLSSTCQVKVNMGSSYILRTNLNKQIVSDDRCVLSYKSTDSLNYMKTIYISESVSLECVLVSMGNPHCVIFLGENQGSINSESELDSMDISVYGKKIESDPLFIDSCNVEFVSVIGNNRLKVRVWERGAGETLACGTGACAVAVASVLTGKSNVNEPISIEMPGGELMIDWNIQDEKVYKTGPATTVYNSEISILQQ